MTATRKHAGHLTTNKDFNELIKDALAANWTAEKTKKNHIKLTAPNGNKVVCAPAAGDQRALKNVRSDMERACPGWDKNTETAPTATTAMAAIATAKKKPPTNALNEAGRKKPAARTASPPQRPSASLR